MNYNPIYFITAASVDEGVLTLTVNGLSSVETKSVVRLIFAPNVAVPADATETSEVQLSFGGTLYPLKDKFGMAVTLSEIPVVSAMIGGVAQTLFATRKPIICGVGIDNGEQFLISWNLPYPKEFIIPLNQ